MSKLKWVLFFILLSAALWAQEPVWEWGVRAGDGGYEEAKDIVCDSAGNVYVTGYYQGAVQFGNWNTDSGDDMEIFVVKYDAQGNFLWAQHAGSPYNDSAEDIAIDSVGNVYITGWFQNVATFGALGVVSEGSSDMFIAKLNSSGNWLYVNGAGGLQGDHGYSIAAAGDGHVYVAGGMYEEAFFGDYSIECDYLTDMFVAEADENGNWLWAQWAGGPNTETCWSLAADGEGNCYMAGYISPDTYFGSIHLDTLGPYDSFIAKLSDGAWEWAIQVNSDQMDEARGIVWSAPGFLYVAGYITGPAQFGSTLLTPYGQRDIYVGKLSPSGNWAWAVQAGGAYDDEAFDVNLDPQGNIYVAGSIQRTVQFGDHSYPSGWSTTGLFVAKAAPTGEWLWAKRAPGDTVVGYSVAADALGRSYVCGYFFGEAYLDDVTLLSGGAADILIGGLSAGGTQADDGLAAPVTRLPYLSTPRPNPLLSGIPASLDAEVASGDIAVLTVCNLRGQVLHRKILPSGKHNLTLDTASFPSGVLLCRLISGNGSYVRKIAIMHP